LQVVVRNCFPMTLSVAIRMLAFGALTLAPLGGHAFAGVSVETEVYEWVEESSPASASATPAIASFGPFQVVAPDRVELNGSIESDTPAQFRALLRAYPSVRQIDMVDCPGTGDDEANLALARMVRQAGIATYVPDGGSVRSGGVELFLAGAKRHADPNAEFAVHSWLDEDGLEPGDFADSDPVNHEYIEYYREMGMSEDKAKAFYALTNSVAHDDALYLKPRDIAAYIPLD
jgi:ATP-dependent protease ClpP protease subunit